MTAPAIAYTLTPQGDAALQEGRTADAVTDLAALLIGPIEGRDTRWTERQDEDRYTLHEITAETHGEATAGDIVAAVYGWAVEVITQFTNPTSSEVDRQIARQIIAGRWEDVIRGMEHPESYAGIEIWDTIGQINANK